MNMPARAPVMPLAQTREEINATAAALRHLAAIWGECFSSVQLDKRAVERVCIVGSGAPGRWHYVPPPGWGNTHICFVPHCKRGIFFRLI